MDVKEVVRALKGDWDWSISLIIEDIKVLTSLFRYVVFEYIPIILNGNAHKLAKFCYSTRQDIGWERSSTIIRLGG